jgi:hypothetical protein
MSARIQAGAAGVVIALAALTAAACGGGPATPAPKAQDRPRTDTAGARPPVAIAPGVTASGAGTEGAAHPSREPVPGPRRPGSAWWRPESRGPNNGPEFQWELDHQVSLQSGTDLGGAMDSAAHPAMAGRTIYDIDGIENSASTVAALHRMGGKVICYVEVGSAGNYYPAADEGRAVSYYAQLKAAGDLGAAVAGYPEQYLNINAPSTVTIIESMIRQQCAAKGFDAVEPDIDDSYTDHTGFPVTEAENVAYDRVLGSYAHRLGLAWGQKNGDNDPSFAAALEPTTDFLITEECRYFQTCGIVTPPYVRAGKLVLDVEYTDDWGDDIAADLSHFCAADLAGGIDGTLFTTALNGPRYSCR